MPSKRIAPAAEALIDTLHAEVEVLEDLERLYKQQLKAIRDNDSDTLGSLTTKVQDCTASLEEMSQKSKRQARLLGRVLDMEAGEPSLGEVVQALTEEESPEPAERLASARAAVSEQAETVNQRRETLHMALSYAAELNHELLVAMREAAAETDAGTYTASGQSESGPPSDDRSFINTVG